MDLRSFTFGVEIETIGQTRGAVAAAIQGVVGGGVCHVRTPPAYDPWHVTDPGGRIWQVVCDSSLSGPSDRKSEVVTPILVWADMEVLQEVVRAVRRCGARVDQACGLHVHVGVRELDGRQLGNLCRLIFKQERLVLAALGVDPERLRRYAKPIDPQFIARLERERPKTRDEFARVWYHGTSPIPTRYHPTRYAGVNMNSTFVRQTAEFRYAQSSLHAGRVKACVQFCLALVARAASLRAVSSRQREYNEQSAKYDFRVFLLRLGLIGPEFATARKHLLASLPGDCAFRNGRPKGQVRRTKEEGNP